MSHPGQSSSVGASQIPDVLPLNVLLTDLKEELRLALQKDQSIVSSIEALVNTRTDIERKLDAIISSSAKPVHSGASTNEAALAARMEIFRKDAQKMATNVHQTSVFARGLSDKVRALDTAQSRLVESLDRVEGVLNLKSTIDKVQLALEERNLELAAKSIFKVLHNPAQPPIRNDSSFELLLDLEQNLRGLVDAEVDKTLAAPVADTGVPDYRKVLKLCRLYGYLGHDAPFVGVSRYCDVCLAVLQAELDRKGLLLDKMPDGAVVQYSDLLASTLQLCALTWRTHQPTLQSFFGRGAEFRLIQQLLVFCDGLVEKLIRRFLRERQVASTADRVRRAAPPSLPHRRSDSSGSGGQNPTVASPTNSSGSDPDPSALDVLLDEIVSIARECEVFDAHMREFGKTALNTLKTASDKFLAQRDGKEPKERREFSLESKQDLLVPSASLEVSHAIYSALEREGAQSAAGVAASSKQTGNSQHSGSGTVLGAALPHVTKVNTVTQEMIGHYVAIEEYYMIRNVFLAIRMEEHSADALTTSLVDECFFVLKKCAERAFSSHNISVACAVINHVINTLSREYKEVLDRALGDRSLNATQLGKMLTHAAGRKSGAASALDPADKQLFEVINNISASADNVITLKRHLEREAMQIFPNADSQRKIKMCLDDLEHNSGLLKKLLQAGLTDLASKLTLALKSLDRFQHVSFDIKEQEYASGERESAAANAAGSAAAAAAAANEPATIGAHLWADRFIRSFTIHVKPIKTLFLDEVYDELMQAVVSQLVQKLEGWIMRKKFTFWGGLQLDKDVRKLTAYFANVCRKSVRDKFSRLVQIASILQLEKASEILDYWNNDDADADASDGYIKLSATEVKAVLALRVDFTPKLLAQLKL